MPTDALDGAVPAELTTLSDGALEIFDAAGSGDWAAASATIRDMEAAWQTYRGGDVPRLIEPRMDQALATLAGAVRVRKATEARDAAIEAARSSLDLQLPYRPEAEIDLARMDLWAAQLLVDEAAGDAAGVGADQFALDYDRDRIRGAVDARDLTRDRHRDRRDPDRGGRRGSRRPRPRLPNGSGPPSRASIRRS